MKRLHDRARQRCGDRRHERITDLRKSAADYDSGRVHQVYDMRQGHGQITGQIIQNGAGGEIAGSQSWRETSCLPPRCV